MRLDVHGQDDQAHADAVVVVVDPPLADGAAVGAEDVFAKRQRGVEVEHPAPVKLHQHREHRHQGDAHERLAVEDLPRTLRVEVEEEEGPQRVRHRRAVAEGVVLLLHLEPILLPLARHVHRGAQEQAHERAVLRGLEVPVQGARGARAFHHELGLVQGRLRVRARRRPGGQGLHLLAEAPQARVHGREVVAARAEAHVELRDAAADRVHALGQVLRLLGRGDADGLGRVWGDDDEGRRARVRAEAGRDLGIVRGGRRVDALGERGEGREAGGGRRIEDARGCAPVMVSARDARRLAAEARRGSGAASGGGETRGGREPVSRWTTTKDTPGARTKFSRPPT